MDTPELDESVRHGTPGPLGAPTPPIIAIEQNAKSTEQYHMATSGQKCAVANFFVAGAPDAIGGVLKAVYQDLTDGNMDACIELREAASYIRISAPTKEDALALLRTTQRIARDHLLGISTEAKVIFVEPPTSYKGNFQVVVRAVDEAKSACSFLEDIPGTPDISMKSASDRYRQELSENVLDAFEKASNLHTSLVLKVRLGCYLLQRYKAGNFTLKQFEEMVKNPQATGQFITRLGKVPSGKTWSVDTVMRLIQAPNSPCHPRDNQTINSAHVAPAYVLECWHENDRYETELEISRQQWSTKRGVGFHMSRTKMVPESVQVPRFEVISISIGRQLDWAIVAMPGDKKFKASQAVLKYLESGTAVLQGSCNDFQCYPRIRLPVGPPLATKLKSLTTKSIYRFGWGTTGYIVQFTINRRWPSIAAMNSSAPTETDFDITIYAENWDQDSRVHAGETVGKIWGGDLQGLLRDEAGDATGSALSRVQGLVKTILDIRDFFEGSHHV
ncbi:hypothetical protein F4802DRAFT_615149 [Xylaria palmicola]|nr:hypothetical protein F4802DRAFT_615149 [Xylaria palmicola]